jgi:hypothetical protein
MARSKPIEWCTCATPVRLCDADGVPFCPEGQCQTCRRPVRRSLPPGPIQAVSPRVTAKTWTLGQRPPELETPAAARGLALAAEAQRVAAQEAALAAVAPPVSRRTSPPTGNPRTRLRARLQALHAPAMIECQFCGADLAADRHRVYCPVVN